MNEQIPNRDRETAEALIWGKKLAFLVGAGRSGTTWLQLLLSRLPSVVTAPETHLFNLFLRSMLDEWYVPRTGGSVDIGVKQLFDQDEFKALLRSVSVPVFAKIAQKKPSASIILEKTPDHVHCWREILDLWPDAHFIHIIRDPRSVVASMKIASKSWAPWWGHGVSSNCEDWVSAVRDGRQIRSATQNYQEVTYEELRSTGPEALARLARGLGATADLAECERYIEECSIANLKAGKLENAPFEMSERNQGYRRGETDSWRVELSKWELALVEHLTRPTLSELGYTPSRRSAAMSASVELTFGACRFARFVGVAANHQLQRFANRILPV